MTFFEDATLRRMMRLHIVLKNRIDFSLPSLTLAFKKIQHLGIKPDSG